MVERQRGMVRKVMVAMKTYKFMLLTKPTMGMVKRLLEASKMKLVKRCVSLPKMKAYFWVVTSLVSIAVPCVEREEPKSVYPAARRQGRAAADVGYL